MKKAVGRAQDSRLAAVPLSPRCARHVTGTERRGAPQYGYGMRVPAIVISPYARKGYIDHQVLSFDAYNKFIEDDFLNGARLNPRTDGRPDPRPDVREIAGILGDLRGDFNFRQRPRPAVLLPTHPAPGPPSTRNEPDSG